MSSRGSDVMPVSALDPELITTRDGTELFVRPMYPGDRAAYLREFEQLGEQTRYRRFLAPIKQLSESEVTYFTNVDHSDHEALIAVTREGEIVGVARYIRLTEGADLAEVAVTVADAWQGRGVGTILLHRLADRAGRAGVETFRGICLTENTDMQQLLRELGPEVKVSRPDPDLIQIDAKLPAPGDTPDAVRPAIRPAPRGHEYVKSTGPDRPGEQ
jgi:RimJ/RimL family protein N-acetyltransferase